MARAKKKTREQQIEHIQEVLETKQIEKKAASVFSSSKAKLSVEKAKVAFQEYWAMNRSRFDSSREMEPIIWAHLKAINFMTPEQFEDGVLHFGLKLKQ